MHVLRPSVQCPHFSPQLVMNPCPCGTGPFASAAPSADREQPPAPVCIFWGALNLEKVLEMTLTWSERCPFSRQIRIHMHGYTLSVSLSLSLSLSTFYWVASHASYHRQAFICKIRIISAIMLLPYETRTSCSWSWILFNIASGSFCPCWILSAVLDLFSETKIHLSQWAVPKIPVISIYLVCWYGFHIDAEMNYISHPISNLCSYSIVIPSGCHWLESPCLPLLPTEQCSSTSLNGSPEAFIKALDLPQSPREKMATCSSYGSLNFPWWRREQQNHKKSQTGAVLGQWMLMLNPREPLTLQPPSLFVRDLKMLLFQLLRAIVAAFFLRYSLAHWHFLTSPTAGSPSKLSASESGNHRGGSRSKNGELCGQHLDIHVVKNRPIAQKMEKKKTHGIHNLQAKRDPDQWPKLGSLGSRGSPHITRHTHSCVQLRWQKSLNAINSFICDNPQKDRKVICHQRCQASAFNLSFTGWHLSNSPPGSLEGQKQTLWLWLRVCHGIDGAWK